MSRRVKHGSEGLIRELKAVDRHVGNRILMRRKQRRLTEEKLGDAMGLSFQQVQKYQKGTNRISASRLQQLSIILQVPVEFFFEGAPKVRAHPDDNPAT